MRLNIVTCLTTRAGDCWTTVTNMNHSLIEASDQYELFSSEKYTCNPVLNVLVFITTFCWITKLLQNLHGYFLDLDLLRLCVKGVQVAIQRFFDRVTAVKGLLTSSDTDFVTNRHTDKRLCTVPDKVLVSVENLHPKTNLTDLANLLHVGTQNVNIEMALSTDNSIGTNRGVAVIAVSRTYLAAKQLLLFNGKEFCGRKLCIKEIKNRKLLTMKKSSWMTAQKTYAHVCPILKLINTCFGYHQVDGGASSLNKIPPNHLEAAISDISKAGIEKIVMKPNTLRKSEKMKGWCRTYKHYLYYTTVLETAEKSYDFERFERTLQNDDCVGIRLVPLCYRNAIYMAAARINEINCFKKQIEIAIRYKKPLLFCLRNQERAHLDFLEILREFKNQLPPCQLETNGVHNTNAIVNLIKEFNFYIAISAHHLNVDTSAWMRTLLYSKAIKPDRIILHSDGPKCWFGRSKPFDTYKEFQINFTRSQIQFLHQDAVNCNRGNTNTSGNVIDPRVLHCTLEMVCPFIHLHPHQAALIFKQNAQAFYRFDV